MISLGTAEAIALNSLQRYRAILSLCDTANTSVALRGGGQRVSLCWCGCSGVARSACSDQIFTSQRHQRQPQICHKRHTTIGTKLFYLFTSFMCFVFRNIRLFIRVLYGFMSEFVAEAGSFW